MAKHVIPESEWPARFWRRVTLSPGCWEWQGGRGTRGYGRYSPRRGHSQYAHRYAYQLAFGPIPEGYHICHHCDNPPCVRPTHLFAGTASDNAKDMWAKGRASFNLPRRDTDNG